MLSCCTKEIARQSIESICEMIFLPKCKYSNGSVIQRILLTGAIDRLTFYKKPCKSKVTETEKATCQKPAESYKSYKDEYMCCVPFRYSDSCTNNIESQGAESTVDTDTEGYNTRGSLSNIRATNQIQDQQ